MGACEGDVRLGTCKTLHRHYSSNMEPNNIGIIADTHGRNELMRRAIDLLEARECRCIIHLGDICDSLHPQTLDEAMRILAEHRVQCILGNNEDAILTDGHEVSPHARKFLASLPYIRTIDDFGFTHSQPGDCPAATRRPIEEYLAGMPAMPYRILFRGHSHSPGLFEVDAAGVRAVDLAATHLDLDREKTYIVTIGAVQNSACALFEAQAYSITFLSL